MRTLLTAQRRTLLGEADVLRPDFKAVSTVLRLAGRPDMTNARPPVRTASGEIYAAAPVGAKTERARCAAPVPRCAALVLVYFAQAGRRQRGAFTVTRLRERLVALLRSERHPALPCS